MDNQQAYNEWSEDYDMVINKTRDLEGIAIREVLKKNNFKNVLEIGCGTGKNTEWLLTKAEKILGVDFSEKMLLKAESKIKSKKVGFIQFDIRNEWNFGNDFDLITCSLVLEHIRYLNFIFNQAKKSLVYGGLLYLGELHPFKQYKGTKAKFQTQSGMYELECFTHNISEFFNHAQGNGFECIGLQEWFDEDDNSHTPRLLTMLFRSKE